jgi:hypothetical protein
VHYMCESWQKNESKIEIAGVDSSTGQHVFVKLNTNTGVATIEENVTILFSGFQTTYTAGNSIKYDCEPTTNYFQLYFSNNESTPNSFISYALKQVKLKP